nr:flagellar biosynthetic protein FliR [Desulfurispira natronophila]
MQEVNALILSFIRNLSIIVSMPILSGEQIKMQIKIGLAILITVLLFPVLNVQSVPIPPNVFELVIVIFKEIFIGLAIGFAGQIIMATIQFAGHLMGFQMGLTMANVLDPVSNVQVPIIGQLLSVFVVLLFLLGNGHHMVLMGLYDSYSLIPLGKMSLENLEGLAEFTIYIAHAIFIVGFKISGPIFVVTLIAKAINGILGKMVPQINLLTVGLPVQIFVGILTLALVAPALMNLLEGIFNTFHQNVYIILRIFSP